VRFSLRRKLVGHRLTADLNLPVVAINDTLHEVQTFARAGPELAAREFALRIQSEESAGFYLSRKDADAVVVNTNCYARSIFARRD
jgi:hypothetical protein